MAMFLAFMNKYPLEGEEDVEDIDSNSHIETIIICPLCGTLFFATVKLQVRKSTFLCLKNIFCFSKKLRENK